MNLVLKINEIIKELGYDETPEVSVSNRPDISDYQYNGAFKLAKTMHKSPMVIADEIVSKLKNNDMFSEVSNVNGFINITLSDKALIDYLNEIVNNFDINTFKINTDETIFLDYGGANVAKALHAGHLRSPNIGEALKRLCEAVGYKTISDVHYGDWGRPMGLIICEIKHRYPNLDFFNPNLDSYPKESPVTLEDLYTIYPLASAKSKEDEEYLNEARELTVKLQKKEKGIYDLYKAFTKLSILDIEDIYKKLNCTFDLYEGERDADDYIQDVLTVTKPFTTISNGATIIDVKEKTDKKEIPPVMLLKSDGGVLYDTTELATLYSRIKRFKASKYFYLTDVRQELHFVEAFRAAYKTGIVPKDISLEWFGFGTLNGPDGKPFNMRSLNEICEYIYKLTSSFNAFYSNHEVLTEKNECIKESYLTLINEVYKINKYLLNILAITLPDKI